MMFCPKCGSLMIPASGKKAISCSCGYSTTISQDSMTVQERGTKKQEIYTVEDGSADKQLPTTDADCPNCDHKKAFFWTQQTRAADEGETRFLKCEKCKHTWREYN